MGEGDHGRLVGQDQRSGQDASVLDGVEEPGGVGRVADSGVAQAVGGVLGGGGADHRSVPGPGDGGQDAGLAGAGRAGDHFHGAGRGERVPGGGGLV